jgi:ATP-dependent DNA helicase DinG
MKYAVMDFETTGSQPADEIIQVGLVIIDGLNIVDRYDSFVRPGKTIPEFIRNLTGIDDALVAEAPQLEDMMAELRPKLEGCTIVGHNVSFDMGFLQRALEQCGYSPFAGPVLDTMDMLRILFPALTSLQLSNVSQAFGVEHDRPHRADSDAQATAGVWLRCLDKLQRLPLMTIQRLTQIFEPEASDLFWFINEQAVIKEQTVSLEPDPYKYYRQYAMNVDDWGDDDDIRTEEEEQRIRVPFANFYEELKQSLRHKFEVFETREAQDQMIAEVSSSFGDEKHLMVEAGTGTGKSLAYLIPSLHYGINNDKKILVSTHTINLQEQLRQRDLPLLHDIFPAPFRAAVLKGRSHYLCLRKFEQKVGYSDYEHEKDDRLTAAQMVVWLTETEHGEDEELHTGSKGHDFWRTVASDADSCLNRSCPWFKKCFYHRAKNEANNADLVITNHSLLFTDIKAEHRLLPSYKHLVIDEAHHFEDVASKHLGTEVQYLAFVNSLTWLYKDARSGQLPALRNRLAHTENGDLNQSLGWCEKIDGLYPAFLQVKEHWDALCTLLFELISSRNDGGGEVGQLVLRIKEESLPLQWDKLQVVEDNLFLSVSDVLRQLDRLMNEWKDVQELYDIQGLLTDVAGAVKDLYRHRDAVRFFMKRTDPGYVYWLEANATYKMKSLQLISVPTDVSPMLREYFFEAKDSVVMTSATLSVDKKFDYVSGQLGLNTSADQDKLRTVLLPSPFNYREQALVCVPRDFPTIKGANGEALYLERLISSLQEVAEATKGRMLVLFTSYRMLKQVHAELSERLQPAGIQVLGQGIDSGSRSKLVRQFQNGQASVLLGTSSFWEGVDIPGEALSCLAIVRLPFQPPNHPVVEAKCDNLKKNNQNPFMKYSVPQAVIRFKQGFGRLVRTASDRGIVILYDTRVIDTQYGKYFLYSLPGPKIESMNTSQLVPRIKEWMEEGKRV